jgi:Secretion system C-terminal sorting domain
MHFGRQSYSEAILLAHYNSYVLQYGGCPETNPDCWDINPHILAIINDMNCQVKIPVNQINESLETTSLAYEGVDVAQSIFTNTVNIPGNQAVISNNFINSGRKPIFLGPPALPASYYGAPNPSSVVSISGGPGGPLWFPTIGGNAYVPNTHFALHGAAITPKGAALLNLVHPHLVHIDASAHAILEDGTNNIFIKTKEFDNSNPFFPRLKQAGATANSDISIFPNPVSFGFILKSTASIGSAMQLELTDMMGRVVYTRDIIHKGNNGFEISELPKGLYNVKLTNQGQVSHLRLVKE